MFAGLAAAVLVFVALSNQSSDNAATVTPSGTNVPRVVANVTIPAGTKIEDRMVTVTQVPQDLSAQGAFDNVAPVVGEVTVFEIAANSQVTPSMIGKEVDGTGLSYVVPDGLRAFSIRAEDLTAVGGNLIPGDRVDVIAVFDKKGDEEKKVSLTVLQDIEVLAVAQEALKPLPADSSADAGSDLSTSGEVPEDVETQPGAATVTLAISPDQVAMMAGIQETALKIYTSLRSAGDHAPVEVLPFDVDVVRP
jgi:pilus assembly protein CpaB